MRRGYKKKHMYWDRFRRRWYLVKLYSRWKGRIVFVDHDAGLVTFELPCGKVLDIVPESIAVKAAPIKDEAALGQPPSVEEFERWLGRVPRD